jgi:hypothetical protein
MFKFKQIKPSVHFLLPRHSPVKKRTVRKRSSAFKRVPIQTNYAPAAIEPEEEMEEADESFASLNATISSLIANGQEALSSTPERAFSFEPSYQAASLNARIANRPRSPLRTQRFDAGAVQEVLERSASPIKQAWWES